ncbi:MAG: tetratricopeptide repeat protein [Candidatus Schekmanbacteria bacterium]|nr:tetratricopeptide repeat protein [Candidatus Schekmanbacteria bacterium]
MAEMARELAQVAAEDLRLLLEIGYCETYNKNFEAARTIFEGVSAVRPESDIPLIGLSEVAVYEGHRKAAFDALKRALDVNPKSAMAMAKLGELYYEDGDDAQATAHFQKAISLDPAGDGGQLATLFLDGIKEGTISRK